MRTPDNIYRESGFQFELERDQGLYLLVCRSPDLSLRCMAGGEDLPRRRLEHDLARARLLRLQRVHPRFAWPRLCCRSEPHPGTQADRAAVRAIWLVAALVCLSAGVVVTQR